MQVCLHGAGFNYPLEIHVKVCRDSRAQRGVLNQSINRCFYGFHVHIRLVSDIPCFIRLENQNYCASTCIFSSRMSLLKGFDEMFLLSLEVWKWVILSDKFEKFHAIQKDEKDLSLDSIEIFSLTLTLIIFFKSTFSLMQ